MRGLISYFIRYPVAGNTLLIAIMIFGLIGYRGIKSTFFPQEDSRIISIQATYPGASPTEIEEGVVLKIERNLEGLNGIEKVSSVSSENLGKITVEVMKGYDTDVILQDVKNAVDRIGDFPVGMEQPSVFKVEAVNLAIKFAISGDVDLLSLKRMAEMVEDDLRGIDGISQVNISGYPSEEIEVAIREDDLQKYNLSAAMVASAIRNNNIELTGGVIKGEKQEMLIRARYKNYYGEELKSIVVSTGADGQVVRLEDVADVKDRWADEPARSFMNGKKAVVIDVSNTITEDILYICESTKKYIDNFNARDHAVKAYILNDRSVTLTQRIELLTENGLVGLLLVLLFLTMFLNLRLAFWVALSIPISMLGMAIVASGMGVTINVMSLFGMIIVVGILVDDGIVIAENIYQHWERGVSPMKAAIAGTMEVFPAIVSAILTTVVAFMTFFFLDGRVGVFASDLAFVVIMTLIFSLVEGAFILPGHVAHSKALSRGRNPSKVEKFFTGGLNWVRQKVYSPALQFTLQRPGITFSIGVGLIMITIGAFFGGIIKGTFFPQIARDQVRVEIKLPAGTNEKITAEWLAYVEDVAAELNEEMKAEREDGKDVFTDVEKQLGPGSHEGSLNFFLLDAETRNMNDEVITGRLREKVGPIHGAESVTYGGISPFGYPISVSLLGDNESELKAAKLMLREELEKLAEIKDVMDNDRKGLPEIELTMKEKAEVEGLTVIDVMGQVRQGFFGNEVQRLQRGLDEVKIWVRYPETERRNLSKLENMEIRMPDGRSFPLKEVADYREVDGVLAINHRNGRREIKVDASIGDPRASISDLNNHIADNIMPLVLEAYPSVTYALEGQAMESGKTTNSAKMVLPIVLFLMLTIVIATFRSWSQALIVFLTIPFGFIGVGWGHWMHDKPVSLLSFFGLIALIGIMVNDSLVFVTTFNQNLKRGKSFADALYETGISRFRPIILTSITTIAGLAPIIFEKSFQAQFLVPMAITIAWGLMVATFVTLLILPAMIIFRNQLEFLWKWSWDGKKPTPEDAEPAVKELEFENEQL